MKFTDAEKKIKSMFKGEYCSLDYRKTYRQDGGVATKCEIYVGSLQNIHKGDTWEEAFNSLDKEVNPRNHVEEMPNELA